MNRVYKNEMDEYFVYTVVMSMSVGESGCATVTGCWQLTNTSPSE